MWNADPNSSAVNVYLATRDLARLLNVDLQFPESNRELTLQGFPEIQLISLLTIAVKLYHPFDTSPRIVDASSNPAILAMDWKVWSEVSHAQYVQRASAQSLSPGEEVKITEKEVLEMSSHQLDQYLDWYGKTWVVDTSRPERKDILPDQLLDMFPINSQDPAGSKAPVETVGSISEEEQTEDRLNRIQGSLQVRTAQVADQEGNTTPARRVGELYKKYRTVQELNPWALAFYTAAADTVGISVPSLVSAVLQMESNVERWQRSQSQRFEEGESNSDGSSQEIPSDDV